MVPFSDFNWCSSLGLIVLPQLNDINRLTIQSCTPFHFKFVKKVSEHEFSDDKITNPPHPPKKTNAKSQSGNESRHADI